LTTVATETTTSTLGARGGSSPLCDGPTVGGGAWVTDIVAEIVAPGRARSVTRSG
jgi:hypothetical protein